MYNVILRRVRVTIVVVLRNLTVRICSLRYPGCNAHAPYCHLWPDSLYKGFPFYLINGKI